MSEPSVIPRTHRTIIRCALLGGAVWIVSLAVLIVVWNRHNAIGYSPHNHFISELGFPATSPISWLLNAAELIGTALVVPVAFAVAAKRATPRARLAARCMGVGLVSACLLGAFGVGVDLARPQYMTMAIINLHTGLAIACFVGWFAAVLLFTVDLCPGRAGEDRARGLFATSVFASVVSMVFVIVGLQFAWESAQRRVNPEPAFKRLLESRATPAEFHAWLDYRRPMLVRISMMEWSVLAVMFLWHGTALAYLRRPEAEKAP